MVLRVPAYPFHVFTYIYHFFDCPSSSALSSSPDILSCILLVWFSTVLPLGYDIFHFHVHFSLHFLQYLCYYLFIELTFQVLNCHHYFIQLFVFSWTSIRDLFLGTRVLLGSWWWYMWLPEWGLTRGGMWCKNLNEYEGQCLDEVLWLVEEGRKNAQWRLSKSHTAGCWPVVPGRAAQCRRLKGFI